MFHSTIHCGICNHQFHKRSHVCHLNLFENALYHITCGTVRMTYTYICCETYCVFNVNVATEQDKNVPLTAR